MTQPFYRFEIDIPGKIDKCWHAGRSPANDDEILAIASGIFRDADLFYCCDPRQWDNYDAFVGFMIGRACQYHNLSIGQYDKLVGLCMAELKMRQL